MDQIDSGWFNPTLLGVLLVVIVSVIYWVRELARLGANYIAKVQAREEKSDLFFQEMIRARDEQHVAQIKAWEELAKESVLATQEFSEAMRQHEKLAIDRNEVLLKTVLDQHEQAAKRDFELLESIVDQRKEAQIRFEKMVEHVRSV